MNSMRITGILKNVHLELPQRKAMTLLFSIIDWASQSYSMVSYEKSEGVLARWLSWNNDLNNDHCFAVDGRIQVRSYFASNHLITLKTKPSHRWLPIFIPFFFYGKTSSYFSICPVRPETFYYLACFSEHESTYPQHRYSLGHLRTKLLGIEIWDTSSYVPKYRNFLSLVLYKVQ